MLTIEIGDYDMFQMDVDAIVNPCNAMAIAGAGLSLKFRQLYPDNYREYVRACRTGELKRGTVTYTVIPDNMKPFIVFNFPSMPDLRRRSTLEDITITMPDFLDKIKECVREHGMKSIAVPALGCGIGNLSFDDVYPVVRDGLRNIEQELDADLTVYLILPKDEPAKKKDPGTEAQAR